MSLSARLRAEVTPMIGNRPVGEVAREMAISRTTLWRFMRGKPVNSVAIDRVDEWRRSQLKRK